MEEGLLKSVKPLNCRTAYIIKLKVLPESVVQPSALAISPTRLTALVLPGNDWSILRERYATAYTSSLPNGFVPEGNSNRCDTIRLRDLVSLARSFRHVRQAYGELHMRCLKEHASTRSAPDYRMHPHREVLERGGCDCIEAAVMKQTLL